MTLSRPINSPTLVSKTIVGQKPEEQKKNAIFQVFFKPRFINKQVKSLTQNAEMTFNIDDVFLRTKYDNKCELRSISVYHTSEELLSGSRSLRSETKRIICRGNMLTRDN